MRRLRQRLEPVLGPRWPPPVRLGLALGVASAGYVSYRFRLTSAAGFGGIAGSMIGLLLVIRAILWRRKLRQGTRSARV